MQSQIFLTYIASFFLYLAISYTDIASKTRLLHKAKLGFQENVKKISKIYESTLLKKKIETRLFLIFSPTHKVS